MTPLHRYKISPISPQVFVYRYEAAGSLVGGGWLVTGGSDGGLLSSAVLYSNGAWHDYASMPDGVKRHCQVTVGNEVFVIGGLNGDGPVSTVYKLSHGIWFKFSSLKTRRWGHMCSVLCGNIYVMVGVGNYLNSTELLRHGSNEWVPGPPLPGPVYHGQSVIQDFISYWWRE